MDILDDEILKLWRAFHQNALQYIMVGGFATNLHGFQRTTGDLDIWIKDTLENRRLLRRSLRDIGVGDFEGIETMDFVPGWSSIALLSGFELDVMTYLKGFEQDKFDDCFQMAPTAIIHDIPVRFLHINQLIEAKKASARERDLLDIIALENLKAAQLSLEMDLQIQIPKMHYLFLLRPDSVIMEKIKQARGQLEKLTEANFQRRFVPHITVLDFNRVENDKKVMDIAASFLSGQKGISLKIKEASRFDHKITETIAATFDDPKPISQLHHHLSLAYDERPKLSFVPHITIAKEIPKTRHDLSSELSPIVRGLQVECNTLVILRKPITPGGEEKSYTNIGEIKLQA